MTPRPMTHDERLALIAQPLPWPARTGSAKSWAGSVPHKQHRMPSLAEVENDQGEW